MRIVAPFIFIIIFAVLLFGWHVSCMRAVITHKDANSSCDFMVFVKVSKGYFPHALASL